MRTLAAALAVSVSVVALACPADAQATSFSVAGGDLKQALDRYATQSGVQLIYRVEDVRGMRTAGINGTHSVDSALESLLRGTGLASRRDASGAVAIVPAAKPAARTITGRMTRISMTGSANAAPQAQEDEGGLSDIIVTATRRETNVQDTPLAITAVSGDSLRQAGITDPRDLSSLAPSLTVDQGLSNSQTHVSIRGIASSDFTIGATSPVAINIDDVYQPFQYGLGTQVFDLNRVEVLRGPQGTLFGKNTTSGALNYYSQTPTSREEGYFQVDGGGGDFGHYSVEGAFNKPLTENLAMRVSLRVDRRDDYIDNLFDGSKLGQYTTYNGRFQLAWTPGEDTSVNLKLFGLKSRGDGPVYMSQYLNGPCPVGPFFPRGYLCGTGPGGTNAPESPNNRQTYSEVPVYENFHSYGGTLKIEQGFGDSTLTSITAYQQGAVDFASNDDGVGGDSFHSIQSSRTWQVSQELRFATPASAPLRAVVGLYGMYDKIEADQGSISSEIDNPTNGIFGYDFATASLGIQKTTSLAAFTSVTWDVSDRFSLVGGLRYSSEKKEIGIDFLSISCSPAINGYQAPDGSFPFASCGFRATLPDLLVHQGQYRVLVAEQGIDPADLSLRFEDEATWKRATWDVTANFKPSDDSLLFARVASGFRSGGFPVGVSTPISFRRLSPETVMSYEVGFKSEWFGRTLRLNGSAYWIDYNDMIVQITNSGIPGSTLGNAGRARIKGAELEMEWAPAQGLRINGSVSYNDAKYLEYTTPADLNRPVGGPAGNRLPYSPEWTASFGASYELPTDADHSVILGTNWNYRDRIYFDPFQERLSSDDARLMGNLRISYGTAEKGWRLSAYVNNVTDQMPRAFVFPFGGQNAPNTYLFAPTIYAPGRTWGLQGSFDF